MRVGIVFLSFGKDIFAGIENSLYNLAIGLIANGASVHVYSGYLSGAETDIDGISVHRSAMLPSTIPDGDETVRVCLANSGPDIAIELAQFVTERDLQILYVCDPLWGIVQLTEAWKYTDCPMLLALHVLNEPTLLEGAREAPFRYYTAVSDDLRARVLEQVELFPLTTVPNSIDVRRFRPSPDRNDAPIVFCNARLSPEKGILDLVRAFPRVLAAVPQAELWLCAGDSPFGDATQYTREVVATIHALDIARCVRLLPRLAWEDIPDVIRESALIALPSLQETFGLGALEGMACGKAIVATRVGNLPNLIGDAGILVSQGSPVELGDAIVQLLTNSIVANTMGTRGAARALRYANERVASDLLQLMATF